MAANSESYLPGRDTIAANSESYSPIRDTIAANRDSYSPGTTVGIQRQLIVKTICLLGIQWLLI